MGFFSSITEPFTGKEAAKQAKRAGRRSERAEREAREQLIERTQPFVDVGNSAATAMQPFIDDPTGYSFLENNPMFQAAVDNAGDQLMNVQGAAGKVNSGGTIDQLFKNYLAIGDSFVNSGFERVNRPFVQGGNLAAGVGSNVGNSITSGANALNAGYIGAANARSAGMGNLLSLGSSLLGGFGGFGGGGTAYNPSPNVGGFGIPGSGGG